MLAPLPIRTFDDIASIGYRIEVYCNVCKKTVKFGSTQATPRSHCRSRSTTTGGATIRTQRLHDKRIHAYFEGEFVKRNLRRNAVAAEGGPHQPCGYSTEERTKALLLASLAQVRRRAA